MFGRRLQASRCPTQLARSCFLGTEKGASIRRLYFLDMSKCLDPSADREEAVLSVPETLQVSSDFGRKVDLDVSTPELQFAQRLFPRCPSV